jgi:hypothetical protein
LKKTKLAESELKKEKGSRYVPVSKDLGIYLQQDFRQRFSSKDMDATQRPINQNGLGTAYAFPIHQTS